MEVSAILIAHRGKGNVAAYRQSGFVHKIAAGDEKLGRVGAACFHSFGKQAVADDDGSAIIHERHVLFKGSALDRGISAGGVYLNRSLKGAAGDGSVVVHKISEGAAGDGFVVAHILLEGTTGDVAVVVHLPVEGTAGDGAMIVSPPADGAAVKFGIFTNIEICLQCAFSPGLRRGLQGEGAVVQE